MLFLLPLVALAGWLMLRARRLQHAASCRLKGVAPQDAPSRLGHRDWLALVAFVCTILALARPQWNPRPYGVERRGRDLVIALDVSRSMLAADVFPSRLESARIAILEAMPSLSGQRIALITFAGSASVRVPLTLDHGFVRYMLDRADPSDADLGSTSLQAVFEKAAGTVLTDTAEGRDLVLFTDGEDHLSDLERTAETLQKFGARVLIIGLGDPVRGARVPDASGNGQWLRYNDKEVFSRLDDETLRRLSLNRPHVTYHPACTRPFDLVLLYEQLIADAPGSVVVGELRLVRYTEGYALLLAATVALWLASSGRMVPVRALVLLVLLLSGCGQRIEPGANEEFRTRLRRGDELLRYAQEQAAADTAAQRSLLLDAREEFLRAALLQPGNREAARQITMLTHRLRELEAVIEKQRAEEERRHEQLAKIIERLERLSERQERLAQQSQRLLRQRLVPPKADLSDSGAGDNEMYEDNTAAENNNDSRLARTASAEQQTVRAGTADVLDSVASQQKTLRELLTRAYGDIGAVPATELDAAVELLTGTVESQQQALAVLVPPTVRWPKANTALHTAAGRMQQALEALRLLQPPSTDEKDNSMPSRNEGVYDEEMEVADSESQRKAAQPVTAGDFQAALSLRSLPVPNYTSAEILAEEAANQQKRARRKAASAGARVEKNW
jgi:Ca-activated chloride channel family protein